MSWNILPYNSQILAVHAVLLPTGKILYFSGDEHDQGQHDAHPPLISHTRLFDCKTSHVEVVASPQFDVFCAGHCQLGDGRLLVAGGTQEFSHESTHPHEFFGLNDAAFFDFATETWACVSSMNPNPETGSGGGRWYPTLVTLGNGEVLAMAGKPSRDDGREINDSPEIFSPFPPPKGKWRNATPSDPKHAIDDYPRLFLLSDGSVFSAMSLHAKARNSRFLPESGRWVDVCPAPYDLIYGDHASTAVMLPLLPGAYEHVRFLLCGGRQPLILDLSAPYPKWQATLPRNLSGSPQRRYANSVLLPTGDVFVCGGVESDDNTDDSAVYKAELYTTEGNWTTLPAAYVTRNYHSVALLMPDGRVWTAGSNKNAMQSFPEPGVDNRELRIEIFEPDYCLSEIRPVIEAVEPATIRCNPEALFEVNSPQAGDVRRVALLRLGCVTHAFNSDQRYIGLDFQYDPKHPQTLFVIPPPNTNVAPPGFYLLFLIDVAGVPSVGHYVRVELPDA